MILLKIFISQIYFSLCLFKGYGSVNDRLHDTPTLTRSTPQEDRRDTGCGHIPEGNHERDTQV